MFLISHGRILFIKSRERKMKAKEFNKSKLKKYIFLGGLGIVLIGGFSYWYFFGKKRSDEEGSDDVTDFSADQVDVPKALPKPKSTPKQLPSSPKTAASTNSNPSTNDQTKVVLPLSSEYPIKKGSKKVYIKQLQEALIKLYGKDLLKKFGADGDFGSETKNALKSKGYPIEIDEASYKKIIQQAYPEPLKTVDQISASDKENIDITKNLWLYATTKKLNPLLDQLKRIKSVAHYVKVNELFKTIRLNGVRQTIVNGALSSFSDNTSKQFISEALRNIGLKYYDEKWNLSGVDERKIITSQETTICSIDGSCNVRVPQQTVLGVEVIRGKFNTRFRALDNQILYVPTKHIRYV
jgi:hypothetical protein